MTLSEPGLRAQPAMHADRRRKPRLDLARPPGHGSPPSRADCPSPDAAARARRAPRLHYGLAASAVSMAATSSGSSGFTFESKRPTIFPSRSMRNFVKFHPMSPGNGEPGPARAV